MVDYRKIECPWCHNVLFTPISNVSVKDLNGLIVSYRETMCPDCQKRITIIEDITTKFAEDVTLRLDVDNDKVAPLFAELGSKYKITLDNIRMDIDERIGKLRDEWDNLEPENKKLHLIAPDGREISSPEELMEYIRYNYDEDDVSEWINDEFGSIDIGPYNYEPADIVREMEGGYGAIVEETWCCNYASDRVSQADMSYFDTLEEDDIDSPGEQTTVDIAGMTFVAVWKTEEKND